MDKIPLISVIVPVYNGEKFLAECLDSITGQTYQNIEILIVNDGSTDNSSEIIARFAANDHRINIITQQNHGVSAARNTALKLMKGDYVTFVDADDILDSYFLLNSLNSDKEADIIVSEFTDSIKQIGEYKHKVHEYSPQVILEKVLYQSVSNPSVCGKLFKSHLFESLRFWDHRYEDFELFPKLVLHSKKISFTGYTGYYYRKNATSFINTFSEKRFDALKAADSVVDTCLATGNADLIKAAYDRKLSANFNIFLLLSGKAPYKHLCDQCWREIKLLRKSSVLNPKVRIKNKAGILMSYLGPQVLSYINEQLHISS